MIGPQVFRASDAPRYIRGLIVVASMLALVFVLCLCWLIHGYFCMAPVGNVDHRFYSHKAVVGFPVCVCCGWRGRVAGGVGGGWMTEVAPNFRRAREFDRRGRRSTVAAALSTKSCLWGETCYIVR
ncbi:hypothetical protein L1887_61620 [Cichorium endivia]|nr:hypothetical protein L1887_61620 [Cichorium endivia]